MAVTWHFTPSDNTTLWWRTLREEDIVQIISLNKGHYSGAIFTSKGLQKLMTAWPPIIMSLIYTQICGVRVNDFRIIVIIVKTSSWLSHPLPLKLQLYGFVACSTEEWSVPMGWLRQTSLSEQGGRIIITLLPAREGAIKPHIVVYTHMY